MATAADEPKYRTKYKELKVKLNEIEEDNAKLQFKILKSKKAIQRLRLERAILYDRLQASETPTNPFSLHSEPHLAALAPKDKPASTRDAPTYALENPEKLDTFLKAMDAKKLSAVQAGTDSFAERPNPGVATGAAPPVQPSQPQPPAAPAAVTTNGHGAAETAPAATSDATRPPTEQADSAMQVDNS